MTHDPDHVADLIMQNSQVDLTASTDGTVTLTITSRDLSITPGTASPSPPADTYAQQSP